MQENAGPVNFQEVVKQTSTNVLIYCTTTKVIIQPKTKYIVVLYAALLGSWENKIESCGAKVRIFFFIYSKIFV